MRLRFNKTKVALVYDWLDTPYGGAEELLLALGKIFPKAPLYTSIYRPAARRWAGNFKVISSWLNKLPFINRHEQVAPLLPIAFESFDFKGFDLVISVTSSFAKGIVTQPSTLHVCYCLTPTRFLWHDSHLYYSSVFAKPLLSYLKAWDQIAAARPDFYVATSGAVAQRIQKFYHRDVSKIIFPPIQTDIFTPPDMPVNRTDFLLVSRLVPYKHVELAIRAFNKLKYPLVIVGTGSESERLKGIAENNVRFIENLTQNELIFRYRSAKCLIVPQEEDFGLAGLEANSCGTPVIAYRKGGYQETIVDGVSGSFFYPQTSEALADFVNNTDFSKFTPANCRQNALRFGFETFKKSWQDAILTLPRHVL